MSQTLLLRELVQAHQSLARLETRELEVLQRLIEAECERRRPTLSKPLLRFETARQPTAAIIAKILRTSIPGATTAVDLTRGHGCFWREDIPVQPAVTLSPYDFCRLPYADDSYGVALFDPPHNADAGVDSIMGTRFGTFKQADLEPAVRQGVREAWRVARAVVVKVTDAVHGQRFVRMSGWVYDELGEPYEVVHQVRQRSIEDPRWKEPPLSARNNGSSYLVFRKDGLKHVRGIHA